jgi:hypothetical protein
MPTSTRKMDISSLRDALARLPVFERAVLALHYGGGMPVAEIAQSLSIPKRAIVDRMRQSLESLRRDCTVEPGNDIEAEQIRIAISSGAAAPSGLRSRVEAIVPSLHPKKRCWLPWLTQ